MNRAPTQHRRRRAAADVGWLKAKGAGGKPDAWNRRNGSASKTAHLTLQLSPRGGFVGYFSK